MNIKTVLMAIGYMITGRWILAIVCLAARSGWAHIGLHTVDRGDDEYVDGITITESETYLQKVTEIE